MHREVLEARREGLGPRHPNTLLAMSHTGLLLTKLGRWDEAVALLRSALEEQRAILGASHVSTLTAASRLAEAHCRNGALRSAREVLDGSDEGGEVGQGGVVAAVVKIVGAQHKLSLEVRARAALLQASEGDEEGHRLLKCRVEDMRRVLGDAHATTRWWAASL